MTPGPNRILKSPATGTLIKITTCYSGNTFGARFWTDGKCEAPMMPDEPWLRGIPGTGELFWIDECEQVGEESPWDDYSQFTDIPFAYTPIDDDLRKAISRGVANTREREIYVRTRLWWVANDPVRSGQETRPTAPDFRENLEQLIRLLNITDIDERLMAVEAHRELGHLDESIELLVFNYPNDCQRAVKRIRELIAQTDVIVRILG